MHVRLALLQEGLMRMQHNSEIAHDPETALYTPHRECSKQY
jgi:hypothetical protein